MTPLELLQEYVHDCDGIPDESLATVALAYLRAGVKAAEAASDLLSATQQLVEEKADYMRLNHLGDPETQHTIKIARAAIRKAEALS
jgi:hypothetical protein